jgi:hypothetical protein
MNGPEHYREAERLLAGAKRDFVLDDQTGILGHALLALTAVMAMGLPASDGTGMPDYECEAWVEACGTRLVEAEGEAR